MAAVRFAGAPGAHWQLGEERYSRILREREVLGDDARSLRDRGWRELDRLDAEMSALAREAAGSPDYVEVLRRDDAITSSGSLPLGLADGAVLATLS